jgi:hypothetical protein
MQGNRTALAVVVAIVLVAGGWLYFNRTTDATAVQLVPMFASAQKQPPAGPFAVIDANLGGESRQALSTPPASRITYKLRIPDDAWLRVAVGTKPESWTQPGNGVLFLVGVSDGRSFEPLFTQHVNPYGNPGDRKWVQVWVDLSAYAGDEVELVFNTRTSPSNQPDDPQNDHPLWGDPEIIVR